MIDFHNQILNGLQSNVGHYSIIQRTPEKGIQLHIQEQRKLTHKREICTFDSVVK